MGFRKTLEFSECVLRLALILAYRHTLKRYVVCLRGIRLRIAYGIEYSDMSANMEKFIFASSARISDAFDMVEF